VPLAPVGSIFESLASCSTQDAVGPTTQQPAYQAAVSGVELSAGILSEYYAGTTDPTGKTPSFIGRWDSVRVVRLPMFYPDTTCAVVYSGFVSVPADSPYSFALNTQGATQLLIHDQRVEPGQELYLEQGAHPLRIVAAFADKLPASIQLLYAAGDGPEVVVDRSMLFHATPSNPEEYVVKAYAPDSGTQFAQGDTVHVRWATNPDTFTSVVIEISVDEGDTWYATVDHTIASFEAQWGDLGWVAPDSLQKSQQPTISSVSSRCRVSIHNYGQTHFAYSPGTFSIVSRS
jgi:hypothetical protein